MQPPTVTIVTPAYNAAPFIAETIESVLAQEYPAIEYIVMDGGSTDGTVEIVRRYDSHLRWVSGRDGGQSAAINAGWRRGTGSIVAWLNADDTYLPGAVSAAVTALQTSQAPAVYGDCDIVDVGGRLIEPYPTGAFDLARLVSGVVNPIPQPATFIRRSALETAGYLDEQLHLAMDLDCWLRLGLQGELRYLPQRLATLRLHPATKTLSRQEEMALEFLVVYQRFFAHPDLSPELAACEPQAMAGVRLLLANACYMSGRIGAARRYLRAGMRQANTNRTALKLRLLAPLGRPGWWCYTQGRRRALALAEQLRRP